MSKIGVLGEAATTTLGTTTAYIVPTGRGAKVKIMYYGIAGVNSTISVSVNGIPIFTSAALTSGNAAYTDTTRMHGTGTVASLAGGTDTTTVAPGPKEYQLAAGDTITYTIATAAFSSMSFQVIGAEVEVE